MKFRLNIGMLVLIAIALLTAVETARQPLSDFIGHYEGLDYNTDILHRSHQRVRRSTSQSAEIHLSFRAHGRSFRLQLRRDTTTFFNNPELVAADGSYHPLDVSHIYQGVVEGEPSSYVHGSVIDGIFSGRIDLDGETFYIDKAELYFPELQPFHSVIYSDREVVGKPKRKKRSTDESACGLSNESIYKWMKKVQSSAVENHALHKKSEALHHGRYSRQANTGRKKREASRNRMCALFLQSDPMLWNYMTRPQSDKMGGLGYTPERAREEITSLFASHVDGIKKIYSNTTFRYQNYGPYAGFTFAVHRVQINTSSECSPSETQNPFCKANIDVSNFLNLNSLSNHDLYCLAYVFTYRDFSQGTLGLAWVGSYLRASGGLCEKWKEYNENNRRIYKSLNTGIVTLVNYGSRVPPKVSTLTFAHEVGHNFGSPHDSGDVCVPSQSNPNNPHGNYIMFASATSGDKPNNHNFSICSSGNMTLVLDAVLKEQNGKDNCFKESQEAFCGNRIVEGNEQCDCGFDSDCKNPDHPDRCCHAQESSFKCQRMANATCSPSEGPCCFADGCSFITKFANQKCQIEKECSQAAFCNGLSARCPKPDPKEDKSLCNSNTQICKKGECTGTVCEKIEWTSCSIDVPVDDKKFDRGQLCYVSCYNPVTQSCVSTGNIVDIMKEENNVLLQLLVGISPNKTGIRMPAGAPCDNFRGYCDVFQKCRAVNEDGPLARLKNLLFNQQTFNEIRDWITVYWWAVLLMGIGLVILMGLFIKVCAVHTPSSNPNQPQARKLTLPRRHSQRSQSPPPPYSAGLPGPSWVSGGPPQGRRQNRSRSSSSSQQPKSGHHPHGRCNNFEMRPSS